MNDGPCGKTAKQGILAVLCEEREAWQWDGACLGCDPDMFFPERGNNTTLHQAKAVCARCRVRPECLEYAIRAVERFGVWGGTSERERRDLRKARGMGAM